MESYYYLLMIDGQPEVHCMYTWERADWGHDRFIVADGFDTAQLAWAAWARLLAGQHPRLAIDGCICPCHPNWRGPSGCPERDRRCM